MTADDIVTQVTEAPTSADAQSVINGIRSRAMLLEVADLLYIDNAEGHGSDWIRDAIVTEARI